MSDPELETYTVVVREVHVTCYTVRATSPEGAKQKFIDNDDCDYEYSEYSHVHPQTDYLVTGPDGEEHRYE